MTTLKLIFGGLLLLLLIYVGLQSAWDWLKQKFRSARATDAEPPPVDPQLQKALADLRERDPAFDRAALEERAKKTMARVNAAWIAAEMSPVRLLLSDGLFVRFTTQLALMKQANEREVQRDWRVESAALIAVESSTLWDTAHVRLMATARTYDVAADATPQHIDKLLHDRQPNTSTEVWSFLRRRSSSNSPAAKGAALDGQCPQCGAALPPADMVRCTHCQYLVNSGGADWVLGEITQEESWEWRASRPSHQEGLRAVMARDADFSVEAAEDRAGVVMWKWVEAAARGTRDRFERYCHVPGHPEVGAQSLHWPNVDGVELCRVTTGSSDGERALFKIRWSHYQNDETVEKRSQLLLGRAANATSKPLLGSLLCVNCGAPLHDSDDIKCRYCDAVVTANDKEWGAVLVKEWED